MSSIFNTEKAGTMRRLVSTVCAAALIVPLSFANAAYGADMLDGELADTQVEFGTGWYIRGDVGSTSKETTTSLRSEASGNELETDLGSAIVLGLGAGYEFMPGLRGELGLSHYTGLSFAADSGAYSCGTYERETQDLVDVPTLVTDPNTGVTTIVNVPTLQTITQTVQDAGVCSTKQQADVTATTFMANAYVDGPTYFGITPYAGVGVGLAMVTWNNYQDFDLCQGTDSLDCREEGGGIHTLREGEAVTETSFAPAFSVMLGAAYQLNKNMKLDVGYRYTQISDTTIASASDNRFYTGDLNLDPVDIHEVRVGLRYEIW